MNNSNNNKRYVYRRPPLIVPPPREGRSLPPNSINASNNVNRVYGSNNSNINICNNQNQYLTDNNDKNNLMKGVFKNNHQRTENILNKKNIMRFQNTDYSVNSNAKRIVESTLKNTSIIFGFILCLLYIYYVIIGILNQKNVNKFNHKMGKMVKNKKWDTKAEKGDSTPEIRLSEESEYSMEERRAELSKPMSEDSIDENDISDEQGMSEDSNESDIETIKKGIILFNILFIKKNVFIKKIY